LSTDPRQLIPVVILNWNGEDDTIECLRSIRSSDRAGFLPVVVDNGSAPAAAARLRNKIGRLYPKVLSLTHVDARTPGPAAIADLDEDTIVFVQNPENFGFAKGSNVGVRFAESLGAEWVMLLNNDTTVAPDMFRRLRAVVCTEPSFVALTPQIRHFEPDTRIQNCGGTLTYLGGRRYRFANAEASAVPASPHSKISLVTGCALLFRHRVTGPLTEDFFFGEEDYEFSLRLRKMGLPMACVHDAVIRHKGGATIRRTSARPGAILVYYANRLTNVRNYYSRWRWQLTRAAAYAYLPLLLWRDGIDPRKAVGMIRVLERHLKEHRGVGRTQFQAMIGST
jgi:GT2 family glycosyltransferase